MKSISAPMLAHIGQPVTTLATCWKVVRLDGVTLGFTDLDVDIAFTDGVTYMARTGFNRSAIKGKSDMSVDNLEVDGLLDSTALKDSDLRAGIYDFASVEIFLVNWQDLTMGKIILRRGLLGQVQLKDSQFIAEVNGLTQYLQQQYLEVYSADCRADFCDARCALNRATFTDTGIVTAVTGPRRTIVATLSSLTRPNDWHTNGELTWTSGLNNAAVQEVRLFQAPGTFVLYLPSGLDIQVGDTFSILTGCDMSATTCTTKFSNIINFRGEPFVPGQDAMMQTPNAF